ncbi:isochorismate lyase [Enterobacterales bacterium AW_CKDN230030176-1A_HGKHYDSX7]
MSDLKAPDACTSLSDIRSGIDFHDRQIFEALCQRLQYVKAATRFKPNEQAIPAPERVAAMLEDRLAWADGTELDPAFVRALYTTIIHWNIDRQIAHWRSIHGVPEADPAP